MASKILFVLEGEKDEPNIDLSLQETFFDDSRVVIECIFGGEIYQLYRKLSNDAYIDVFELLKERDPEALKSYSRDDFAEIYFFFDYDGHATGASDVKIIELLQLFDNETENGKLYISYPSVEALKHIPDPSMFYNLAIECDTKDYKKIVRQSCDKLLRDFTQYNRAIWLYLLELHLRKMNYIVEGDFNIPSRIIGQDEIFDSQMDNFIAREGKVSVLSGFPPFIHDYFGNKITLEIIDTK